MKWRPSWRNGDVGPGAIWRGTDAAWARRPGVSARPPVFVKRFSSTEPHILSLTQSDMTSTDPSSNLGFTNFMKYMEALPDRNSGV